MNKLAGKLVKTVAGVALVLGWWTLRGTIEGSDAREETAARIPEMVWDGGGGKLSIEADTTTAARMHASFSEEDEDGRSLEASEEVGAGHHVWTIDVPEDVSGVVEIGAVAPKPGDKMSWTVRLNGETIHEQSDVLEKPLPPNYAFALQLWFDDYATGVLSED